MVARRLALTRRQHGVVTRSQLLALGMPPDCDPAAPRGRPPASAVPRRATPWDGREVGRLGHLMAADARLWAGCAAEPPQRRRALGSSPPASAAWSTWRCRARSSAAALASASAPPGRARTPRFVERHPRRRSDLDPDRPRRRASTTEELEDAVNEADRLGLDRDRPPAGRARLAAAAAPASAA